MLNHAHSLPASEPRTSPYLCSSVRCCRRLSCTITAAAKMPVSRVEHQRIRRRKQLRRRVVCLDHLYLSLFLINWKHRCGLKPTAHDIPNLVIGRKAGIVIQDPCTIGAQEYVRLSSVRLPSHTMHVICCAKSSYTLRCVLQFVIALRIFRCSKHCMFIYHDTNRRTGSTGSVPRR